MFPRAVLGLRDAVTVPRADHRPHGDAAGLIGGDGGDEARPENCEEDHQAAAADAAGQALLPGEPKHQVDGIVDRDDVVQVALGDHVRDLFLGRLRVEAATRLDECSSTMSSTAPASTGRVGTHLSQALTAATSRSRRTQSACRRKRHLIVRPAPPVLLSRSCDAGRGGRRATRTRQG